MIRAISNNDIVKELYFETIVNENNSITITIPKETDVSGVDFIDFEYFDDIAYDGDEGYMILPNEGMLCGFKNHEECEYITEYYALPIFGVKTNKRTFVAIVTGMAYNYHLVCGLKDGKYYIYPRFIINGEPLYEDISITYHLLEGKDANYSGMAKKYREYQLSREECEPIAVREKSSPTLKYSKESVMIRVRCAWKPAPTPVPHQNLLNEPEVISACDFDRVSMILDELKSQGVEKAEICLVGFNTKGHDGRWPQCFPVCEEAGGEKKLRELINKAQDMGYQIVCHTNSTDTYEISELWNDDDLLINSDGSVSTDDRWSGGKMYFICPQVAYEQACTILPEVADLGFKGTHYIDVLNIVVPRKCYNPKHKLNISESINVSRKLMKLAKDTFGGYSSEGGCDFGAKYMDYALNLRWGETKFNPLCDEMIPLWQLVYHGIILSNPSMFETMNFSCRKNSTSAKLKLIEYGGRPTFYYNSVFCGDWKNNREEDLICDTDEQLVRSVTQIKEGAEINNILAPLQTAFMDCHEKVSEGVYRITYSNGTVITVDYNKGEYIVA